MKYTLSILPDFLENWHSISHFVWKSTKTLELLRIFEELFDVINEWQAVFDVVQNFR